MDISLRQLEAFVAVVERRSFSRAAEELFLSQSTVSSHVAQLERVLHAVLMQRGDKKRVEPTEAGWRAYHRAREILNLAGDLEGEFAGKAAGQAPITIAASTVPSRYLVPELLSAYAQNRPEARFSVIEGDSAFAIGQLEAGDAALAFVGTRQRANTLSYQAICRDRIVLIAPNTDAFRQLQRAGTLGRDLLSHPVILREPGSGTRREADRYLESIGIKEADLRIVATMSDVESIKKSVANGLGVTIISERAADDALKAGKVLLFQLEAAEIYRELYLVYAKNRRLSEGERAFIAFAQRYGAPNL